MATVTKHCFKSITITGQQQNVMPQKTIISQCFRCAEPKSAVGSFLSRLEIEISPIYSTYFHSDPGLLQNPVAIKRLIIDKQIKI